MYELEIEKRAKRSLQQALVNLLEKIDSGENIKLEEAFSNLGINPDDIKFLELNHWPEGDYIFIVMNNRHIFYLAYNYTDESILDKILIESTIETFLNRQGFLKDVEANALINYRNSLRKLRKPR